MDEPLHTHVLGQPRWIILASCKGSGVEKPRLLCSRRGARGGVIYWDKKPSMLKTCGAD
jgi:hypothetical protein